MTVSPSPMRHQRRHELLRKISRGQVGARQFRTGSGGRAGQEGGTGRDLTLRLQPVSVSGSSSITVVDGAEGRGRRGSRTNESGGGSSRQMSPQPFSRRKKR